MVTDSLKDRAEQYWGPLAKLTALDAIFRACERLEGEGKTLNRELVRAQSGVTYTNLLATGLKLYRSRKLASAAMPHTPTVILHVLAQAVEQQFAQLEAGFAQREKSMQEEIDAVVMAQAADLAAAREQIDGLEQRLLDKNALLEQQIEEQHGLREEVRAARAETLLIQRKLETALGEQRDLQAQLVVEQNRQLAQAADHRAALEALKQEHTGYRQELIAQHDKETARLQVQLGNERGEWKRDKDGLNIALTQAQNQLRQLQDTQQAIRHDITVREQEQHRFQSREADLQSRLSQAEQQLQAQIIEREGQARHIVQLQNELAHLQEQLQAQSEGWPGFLRYGATVAVSY